MQVDAFFARDEVGSFQEIGFQLFKITGFAGVVACCLNAIASLTILLVEARHVVSLPAVDGNGFLRQPCQRAFHINAEAPVTGFCVLIIIHGVTSLISKLCRIAALAASKSSNSPAAMNCAIRFPNAVPSVGPANTGRPVVRAVSSFR